MGLFTNKETDPGLTQAEKDKKFQDALLSVYSQEQLDAMKVLQGFGVDTSYITPENIQPDTSWMGDVSAEDMRSSGVDNIINQSKAGQDNLLKQQEILDNATSVEDIKNSVLETENTWDFGLGETSKKSFVPAIIAAEKNDIPLVEHVGDDRYRIVDIGVEDKDLGDYTKALESQGLLPENPQGWESHRTKDGAISVSTDQPSSSVVKDIFKSVVLSGITQGVGGAFGGAGAAAGAEGFNPFNLGMLRDVADDQYNAEDDDGGELERPTIGDTPVGDRPGWHWERDPDPNNPSGWKTVPDDKKDSEASGGGSPSNDPTGGGEPSGGRGEPVDAKNPPKAPGDDEDRWVWNGDVLVNTDTGEARDVPNPGRMVEGEVYNGDGDPVGTNEDETPGGIWDFSDVLNGLILGDRTTDTGDGTTGDGSDGTDGGGDPGPGGDGGSPDPSDPGDGLVLGPGDRPTGTGDGPTDGPGPNDDDPGDGDGDGPEGQAAEADLKKGGLFDDNEWEDFMTALAAEYPVLQKANIPASAFLDALMRKMQ